MYDTSPESWVLGAVDRLPLMSIALTNCEYKAKSKTPFLAQVYAFVTNVACFFAEKIMCCKNIGY